MPTSRSPSRDPKPAPASRSYRPLVLIGLVAVLAVIVATLPASLVAHLLKSFVYGVTTADAATWAAVLVLIVSAALLATYIPARRATKVDPMVALRYE